MEFFATCSKGLERALGDELRTAGVHGVRPLGAGVSFSGDLKDAYLALLWSRIAGRVLLTLGRVPAYDADELYEGVRGLAWEDHIATGATIAVDAHGTNAKLKNTRFSALRVKDAVCDRLVELRGSRPNVDTKNPDVTINVVIANKRATVSIDLSGASLDRRGYQLPGQPPVRMLRETLAAGMLALSGWAEQASQGCVLLNPLCAGGSLAIEAALMVADAAPGIMRPHWGFEGWAGHDEAQWLQVLEQADERAQSGIAACAASKDVRIIAYDASPAAVDYAQARAKRAGVAQLVRFERYDGMDAPAGMGRNAFASDRIVAAHIPADGSLSAAQMPAAYAELGSMLASEGTTLALLSGNPGPAALLDAQVETRATVVNAGNEEELLVCRAQAEGAGERLVAQVRGTSISVADAGAQQFASRLNKMAKQQRKWARKNDVFAYRIYDADLPDFNLAVDLYEGAGPDQDRRLVYVAEYAAPKTVDPAKAARRLSDALSIVPAVFEVSPSDVFVKQRLRSKGGSQYAQSSQGGGRAQRLITAENGLFFEVNLSDYLDTGLFLDHRDTRKLLATLAKGKVFLNLFSYTATASVYAAAAGAKYTTSVDLSNTYLEWAKRNFSLNELLDDHQEFERADVVSWVSEKRRTRERWDLIFCDPPTYSNSSKMGKRTWDVQRDHAELLIGASRLLTKGGVIVFSCNLRSFKPDVAKLEQAGVQIVDISAKTIPHDYERHPKIHHCYLLRRM